MIKLFLGKLTRFILLQACLAVVFGLSLFFIASHSSASTSVTNLTEYIVKLSGSDSSALRQFDNVELLLDGQQNESYLYSFRSDLNLEELQNQLAGSYEYLQPNYHYQTNLIVNDPGFTSNPENIDKQWALQKAGFSKAWDLTTGSREVVVAVIDTGLDATHEDFSQTRIKNGYDFVNDSRLNRRSNSDDNGHGTLITGVIAASANNNIGIAGAAFGVTIMPIKALNKQGGGTSKQISNAIIWATDNDADVINMSLGGLGFAHDKTLAEAISYAYKNGVVIVAAAGNDVAITGGNLDKEPVFPICHDNDNNMVLGVTATDQHDLKPSFANYGKSCVDVSAPGKRILSTINYDPASGAFSPNSYAYASGTSLAVPYVSAQAALLKSYYPTATNAQIRDRIISSADKIDQLNLSQCGGGSCASYLGGGRINVLQSLQEKFVTIADGDVVKLADSDEWYLINGGKRQLISSFVRRQRYTGVTPITINTIELNNFPEGSYAPPVDGTLVKVPNNPAIYYIEKGVRLPVTYQVFLSRGLSFDNVAVLPDTEVNSWIVGSFLAPPEGTLVKSASNPTVYWVLNQTLHAVNAGFYEHRGLGIFPIMIMSAQDINGFAKGESFIY